MKRKRYEGPLLSYKITSKTATEMVGERDFGGHKRGSGVEMHPAPSVLLL